jgi:hypothetical protein
MKTKLVLLGCAIVVLLSVSAVYADPVTLANFDSTGNPFANWGLGSWQGPANSQTVIDGAGIGSSTNWMQVDCGTTNANNMLILPWYGMWGTFNQDAYNNHSAYAFDIIAVEGFWTSPNLYIKMRRDWVDNWGSTPLGPQAGQAWKEIPLTFTSVDDLLNSVPATVMHVVIPYTDIDATQLPAVDPANNGGQTIAAYWDITYDPNGAPSALQSIFIDNLQFVGDPLPVPEPATIAMLALAGVMGMLYLRKR